MITERLGIATVSTPIKNAPKIIDVSIPEIILFGATIFAFNVS